jgi:hypothetical protein
MEQEGFGDWLEEVFYTALDTDLEDTLDAALARSANNAAHPITITKKDLIPPAAIPAYACFAKCLLAYNAKTSG